MSAEARQDDGRDAVRYVRLWVLYAAAAFLGTLSLVVAIAIAPVRGYWWFAVPVAAETGAGAVFWRIRRFTRTRLARSSS
jgi:hypothetical protein